MPTVCPRASFCLSSLLSFRLASKASMVFRACLLPVFFTVFPTCFQGFHGLQGLSSACLLYCLSDLLPGRYGLQGLSSACILSCLSDLLASMAFRASLLPVFFHDFDYFTNVNGYNFTVVVLRKSKLADKINYAASPLNFQHALNCSSSKLRCQLNVETC